MTLFLSLPNGNIASIPCDPATTTTLQLSHTLSSILPLSSSHYYLRFSTSILHLQIPYNHHSSDPNPSDNHSSCNFNSHNSTQFPFLSHFKIRCGDTLRFFYRIKGGIDYQNRVGSKAGSGGVSSESQENIFRRERLRKLALETVDLSKDPYFMKNHLGTFECKLCLTLHNNEGNYLAHTQGKRHQSNLAYRAAKEASEAASSVAQANFMAAAAASVAAAARPRPFRIGLPGYKVIKQKDPDSNANILLFHVLYPESSLQPRHRFMSTYEQKIEPVDKQVQYLLFACEPYETIAFKIPNCEVDRREGKIISDWDKASKTFTLQLAFLPENHEKDNVQPLPPPRPQLRYLAY